MGLFTNICNKIYRCTEIEPQHRTPSYISGFLGGGTAIGLYEWGLWAAGLYGSSSNVGVVMLKVMAVFGGVPVAALAGAASIGLTNSVLKSCCSSALLVDAEALLSDVREEEEKTAEKGLGKPNEHALKAVVIDRGRPVTNGTLTGYQSFADETGGYHSGEEVTPEHRSDLVKKKKQQHRVG